MSESKPASVVFTNGSLLAKNAQDAADSLKYYVKDSRGSKTLESILSMDPNNSTIAQVVNGQMVAAINTSSDGKVKIDGRNIQLNGGTTVNGRLDLMPKDMNWVDQDNSYHNPWRWKNAHIYFDNYMQLLCDNTHVTYSDDDSTIRSLNGSRNFYTINTVAPGYIKLTSFTSGDLKNQLSRSYLDSSRIETPEVYTDKIIITGHHIRVRDNKYLFVTNKAGTNFDKNGSIGFQVWGGVGLGENTIYTHTHNLYIQRGNVAQNLGQHYSDAGKVDVHCNSVISKHANTVSSRLSIKTDITKVTYDRALAAVEGTDMYDYRYINDDSGQHYVSGIIDDVNPKPQYHMDGMLIDKEYTSRIDANLIGYHHVVIQNLLERLATLEAKLK